MKLIALILLIGAWGASGCRRVASEDRQSTEGESDRSTVEDVDGDTDTDGDFSENDSDTAAEGDGEPSDTSFPRVDPCENPVTDTDEEGNLYAMLETAQNYSFSSSISVETITVRSSSNLLFDWSDVTTDMFGRPLNLLTGVDMMEVFVWGAAQEDLLREIEDDNLEFGRVHGGGYVNTENAITSVRYQDLLLVVDVPFDWFIGLLDVDRYPPEETSYLVLLSEGTVPGMGTRTLAFFQLDPDEENTEVRLSDDSATVAYEVDIGNIVPIAIPPGRSDIVLDWYDESGALGVNAMGAEWIPTRITDVMIFHYIDKAVEDIEDNFVYLEETADETWSVYLSAGQRVKLSRLETEEGEAFEGIDETGTWIFALVCGNCYKPVPWFLSVLYPCVK